MMAIAHIEPNPRTRARPVRTSRCGCAQFRGGAFQYGAAREIFSIHSDRRGDHKIGAAAALSRLARKGGFDGWGRFATVGGGAATSPIARLVMSNDQRVSSRGLWSSFHFQPPSRLGKARLYLASRQPVELHIPPSTHLLRKYSQIQGFITRTEAEPYDQIAGDCCDLFSRWVKEWQSHRGALFVSGSRKRDVAPSWLATSPSPDQ
jgi:hypothetical protein